MKTVAFFNNKGGVGKTSLVYHLAWMFADQRVPTLAIDLDPQANLTGMFLDNDQLEKLWDAKKTVYGCIYPLISGTGDVAAAHVERVENNLSLVAGDLALSKFEDSLSDNWPRALDRDQRSFRVLSSFYRIMIDAARQTGAELILIDVGPNLGAINRAALLAAQRVVIPLAPDLFSLQGLRNLGPTLRDWRQGWQERLGKAQGFKDIDLPSGKMEPAGYVVMQHGIRDSRPVKAYQRWMNRIPEEYRKSVLDESGSTVPDMSSDPYKLALLKHYRSLMPMAMEAHKPIFFLKAADGAIGAHAEAVKSCYNDFLSLTKQIDKSLGFGL